ncbi:MAG TPA: hypothetical protein VF157_12980 [Chloroflexota bacterium]
MEPRIHRFRGGWAVCAGDFAIFAGNREDALREFHRQRGPQSCTVSGCAGDARVMLDGIALCANHHSYVTSRAAVDIDDRTPTEVLHAERVRGPAAKNAPAET